MKLIYDYFAVFSLLTFGLGLMTVLFIAATGSREDGMTTGLFLGFILSLTAFYYFRGRFKFKWSVIQVIANCLLTVGEVGILSPFVSGEQSETISFQYGVILLAFPALIVMNNRLLDHLVILIGGKQRES